MYSVQTGQTSYTSMRTKMIMVLFCTPCRGKIIIIITMIIFELKIKADARASVRSGMIFWFCRRISSWQSIWQPGIGCIYYIGTLICRPPITYGTADAPMFTFTTNRDERDKNNTLYLHPTRRRRSSGGVAFAQQTEMGVSDPPFGKHNRYGEDHRSGTIAVAVAHLNRILYTTSTTILPYVFTLTFNCQWEIRS